MPAPRAAESRLRLAELLPGPSALAELEATLVALTVLDPTREALELVWSVGLTPEAAERWAHVPLMAEVAITDAVKRRGPVLVRDLTERRERYPASAGVPGASAQGSVLVPIWSSVPGGGRRVVGALGVGYPGPPPAHGVQSVSAFAERCARSIAAAGIVAGSLDSAAVAVEPSSTPVPVAEAVDAALLARAAAAQGIDADLLRALLVHVPIGVSVLDTELRFLLVNARAAEVNGASPAAHIGRYVSEVLPGLPVSFIQQLREVIVTGRPLRDLDVFAAIPAAEHVRHWRGSYYPVFAPGGSTLGVAALFDEVTGPEPVQLATLAAEHAARAAVLDTLVRHAPAGIAVVDGAMRLQTVNEALVQIAGDGRSVPGCRGAGLPDVLPDLAGQLVEPLRDVLGKDTTVSLACVAGDRTWLCNAFPIHTPDEADMAALILSEVTQLRRVEQAAAEARAAAAEQERRTALLQRLTAALTVAAESRQVAEVVLAVVRAGLGIDGGLIAQRDPGRPPRLLATVGDAPSPQLSWTDIAAGGSRAAARVYATGGPVVVGGGADLDGGDQGSADQDGGDRRWAVEADVYRTWVLLGLCSGEQVTGIAGFGWRTPRAVEADDLQLLAAVADHTASAVERARLLDGERRARARLDLLATATARLSAPGSEPDRLSGLAETLVAGFCDWCTVFLPDPSGSLRRQVVATADAAARHLAVRMTGTPLVPHGDDDPRLRAWRGGRPVRADMPSTAPYLGGTPSTVARDLSEAIGAGTAIVVPLLARGSVIGVVTAWRRADGEPFDDDDEQALADLSSRAGVAIDNLRLLAERTYVASRLQDSLLPAKLPAVPGVELAAGYLVAEAAADVGGDLYDAFATHDGGYALVVGDVAGRGVEAAGLTGITRTALRALAGHSGVPAALARLNTLLLDQTDDERFLTLAYLSLRPTAAGAVLRVWLAGHPPPILVRPDGQWQYLGTPGPLLGLMDDVSYSGTRHELRPGDTVVAYTDGLIEARGDHGFFGDVCLPDLLPTLAGQPAAGVVAGIEQALLGYRRGGADDTALLVARLTPPTEAPERVLVDVYLPASPVAVTRTRNRVAEALAPAVGPERLPAVLLGVSELLTNAVQQLQRQPPRGPRLDPINLRAIHRGGRLRVEVTNPGPRFTLPGRPVPPAPAVDELRESGRGLLLVRAIASDLGVATSSATTCVWFEIPADAS